MCVKKQEVICDKKYKRLCKSQNNIKLAETHWKMFFLPLFFPTIKNSSNLLKKSSGIPDQGRVLPNGLHNLLSTSGSNETLLLMASVLCRTSRVKKVRGIKPNSLHQITRQTDQSKHFWLVQSGGWVQIFIALDLFFKALSIDFTCM